jgi:hypothetical protein
MTDLYDETHDLFRESFAAFIASEMAPHIDRWEADGIVDRELFVQAGRYGILGMAIPEKHSGGGVDDFRFNAIISQELAAAGMGGATFSNSPRCSSPTLSCRYGRADQKSAKSPTSQSLQHSQTRVARQRFCSQAGRGASNDVDWKRRIVRVEPIEQGGSVRFSGSSQPLSYKLCQAIAEVLDSASLDPVTLTERAVQALSEARGEIPGAHAGRTVLIGSEAAQRWYTFAGLRANVELAARLSPLRSQVTQKDNLYITLDEGIDTEQLRRAAASDTPDDELTRLVSTVSGALKLERVLPEPLIEEIMIRRFRDTAAVDQVQAAPIDTAEMPGF